MQRAALVVVENGRRLIERPVPRLDLCAHEPNAIAWYPGARVPLDRSRAGMAVVVVALAGHTWQARAFGDGIDVGGAPLLSGGTRALGDGDVVALPAQNLALRFEHVDGRMLENRRTHDGALVLDCTADPRVVDGVWPALCRTPRALARATAVSRVDGTTIAFAVEPAVDGAPVRVLAERGPGFEPAVALHIAACAARFFASPSRPLHEVPADAFVVTWSGAVAALPVRRVVRPATNGFGAVVELLGRMLPDDAAIRAHAPAHAVWSRLVAPWLHGMSNPQDAVATPSIDDVTATLDRAVAASRPVTADELAAIARNLCPASWAREQELREEIATLDDAAFEALATPSP